jgi:hypothetical protein
MYLFFLAWLSVIASGDKMEREFFRNGTPQERGFQGVARRHEGRRGCTISLALYANTKFLLHIESIIDHDPWTSWHPMLSLIRTGKDCSRTILNV